jgi:hypothetical protein
VKLAFPLALLIGAPAIAGATGYTDAGQDLGTHAAGPIVVDGTFRVRGGLLYNLDLDRGPTPSGRPLFAIPKDGGQTLSAGDVRLRTDLAAFSPSGTLAVKVRADVFDGAGLSDRIPEGEPARADALVIDRFYGEALTPVGVITAGRIGSTWGLGILANGGDCAECERGDAADRLAFITPLVGHIFAVAYDVTAVDATVPQSERPAAFRAARATDTISVAVMRCAAPSRSTAAAAPESGPPTTAPCSPSGTTAKADPRRSSRRRWTASRADSPLASSTAGRASSVPVFAWRPKRPSPKRASASPP